MHVSKDVIIYAIVSILSIITFYGFLKIGVKASPIT